jgi:DNA helicase-4
LLSPILDDYHLLLSRQNQIDFDDMIGKAIDYVKSGRFKSAWQYILVDEFQDISDARARLVRYLKNSAPECSLFCVGDDWQAIYRFTGSDLSITTNFEQQFGATCITALDLTFRFNSSISDTASRFVLENPKQVQKELSTLQQVKEPAVSLLRADNRNEYERITRVLNRIAHISEEGSSVYLLGRYGFNLPSRETLNGLKNRFPSLKISAHTIHASKGMEADYVVIVGLEKGKLGFPSMKATHPLLEALLPPLEEFNHAEERRLFYVALTRSKQRVYLIADMAVASDFVVELLKNDYAIELNEFDTSLAQQIFHLMKCAKCKTGTMVPRQSHFGAFFGCNHYPLCDHKERGCSQCGGPMQRVGRFKLCLNAECKNWVPTCPQCGAEMVQRSGRYGEFWGCRNYRAEGDSCQHTENEIAFSPELFNA